MSFTAFTRKKNEFESPITRDHSPSQSWQSRYLENGTSPLGMRRHSVSFVRVPAVLTVEDVEELMVLKRLHPNGWWFVDLPTLHGVWFTMVYTVYTQ